MLKTPCSTARWTFSACVLSALLLAAFTGAAAATRIGSFTPTSGPIGTLITVSGSGFTGFTTAWIGAAHDAALTVVSDTSLKIVVPADAVTGAQAVEILSATGSVTAAQKFKVTAPRPVAATRPPAVGWYWRA
jgi:hypothetical protein